MNSFFTNSKTFSLIILLLSLACSQISIAQGHPLEGIAFGNAYFLKNLTTDDQADFSLDTCTVFQTTKEVLPEIWVRVFLDNTIQGYIDKMKEKHPKIQEFRLRWELTHVNVRYKNGELLSITDFAVIEKKVINIENLEGNNVNTVMLKLNDSEVLVKLFKFYTKDLKLEKGFEFHFRVGINLKIQCIYLNILEQGKEDFVSNKKKSSNMATIFPTGTYEKNRFLSIIVK